MKRLMLILIALLLVTLVTAAMAEGDAADAGQVKYQFTVLEDGTAMLTSCSTNGIEILELPETVTDSEGTTYTVTRLAAGLFVDAAVICIPDSVTVSAEEGLQNIAFAYEFRVSDTHPTMAVIDGVLFNKTERSLIRYPMKKEAAGYTIPEGVAAIAPYAFSGYSKLSVLTIPDSLMSVGHNAFFNSSIKIFNISASNPVLAVEAGVLYDKQERVLITVLTDIVPVFSIPEGIERIEDYAFQYNNGIKTLHLPSTLRSIGKAAFYQSSLEEIQFNKGLEHIGYEAFYYTKIAEVTLPTSLTEIGERAFAYNAQLTDVIIPEGCAATIGRQCFSNSSIETITIPSTISEIGTLCFVDNENLKEAVLLCPLESLPDIFYRCRNLEMVSLPDSLQTIESDAFYLCESLSHIQLPAELKSIKVNAFRDCKSLKELYLPVSITDISSGAFSGVDDIVFTVEHNSNAEALCKKYGWSYVSKGEADLSANIPDWLKADEETFPTHCPECNYKLPEACDYNYCPMCGAELRGN